MTPAKMNSLTERGCWPGIAGALAVVIIMALSGGRNGVVHSPTRPGALVPAAHGQSKPDEQLAQLMKRKLEAAQKILEGLALSNFEVIATNAETLIFVSRQAAFRVLPTPEYELHSNEFRRIAAELVDKAREKNLDGATLKYVDLTLTCVKCHKHVRDRRGARLEERIPADSAKKLAGRAD